MNLPADKPYSQDLWLTKRVRCPMDDDTPPAILSKPEECEYQAIALIGDEEVGEPSDIASAVFRP